MPTESINDRLGDGGLHSVAVFREESGVPVALVGPNETEFSLISRPIEIISSSAVQASCSSTATDEVLDSFTITAGVVGVNSILQIEPLWTFTNSANNKILKVKVGGVTVYSVTRTTSAKEAPLIVLANRNSLSSQIQPYDNTYVTVGTGSPATYTIDFSVNVTVEITGQRANAGDTLSLEYYRALHFIGD